MSADSVARLKALLEDCDAVFIGSG
ncbi:hypothetical protein KIPB_016182, partial [Kipferlia bialata]|eukprot:g16182.t1